MPGRAAVRREPSIRRVIPLLLAALSLFGCRELVTPGGGYVIVENVLGPVRIETKDLEGTGWLKAYLPSGRWEEIYSSPGGSFVYDQLLPFHVWHCDPANGSEGCVAKLQAGDDQGYLGSGNPSGAIYVCTENYAQKVGRRHCGARRFAAYDSATGEVDQTGRSHVSISPYSSTVVDAESWPDDDLFYWQGDPMSRFYAGDTWLPDVESFQPPPDRGVTASWEEIPHSTDYGSQLPLAAAPLAAVSTDIGACSLFLPHEWDSSLDDLFSARIAALTEDRGFAELLIDNILADPPAPTNDIEENVFLWADASAVVSTRTDVSPEFHFRVANGEPQMCLKTYMTASNELLTAVEDWYRWDQGLVSGVTSLFNIGSCRAKPLSLMYCGSIGVAGGKGYFEIDEQAIWANMEDYSVFKPSCRNSFRPALLAGLEDAAKTAGEQNLSEGIDFLVQALQDTVDATFTDLGLPDPNFQVRRLELTPSGIYVVTAASTTDSQYVLNIGNCIGDLDTPKKTPLIQPGLVVEYGNRGITRPTP